MCWINLYNLMEVGFTLQQVWFFLSTPMFLQHAFSNLKAPLYPPKVFIEHLCVFRNSPNSWMLISSIGSTDPCQQKVLTPDFA